MKEHIDCVVAERVQPSEMIIDPEAREGHGIILHQMKGVEPDVPKPAQAFQGRITRHISVIIPNESAAKCGLIDKKSKPNDQGDPPGQP